jgi:hypothetical protein
MALDRSNFYCEEAVSLRKGVRVYRHITPDTLATVLGSNYYAGAPAKLRVGDEIIVTTLSGIPIPTRTSYKSRDVLIVTNATGPVVQLANSAANRIFSSGAAVSAPADTNEDTLATITIPANSIGANGYVTVRTYWTITGSTNAKTAKIKFGGTNIASLATSSAGNTGISLTTTLHNRNAANSQVAIPTGSHEFGGFYTTALVTAAIDTTADVTLLITGQKASAGETITLEHYLVEIKYAS